MEVSLRLFLFNVFIFISCECVYKIFCEENDGSFNLGNNLNIYKFSGIGSTSVSENELFKTFYHLVKRSTDHVGPTKKATQNEKKGIVKYPSPSSLFPKKFVDNAAKTTSNDSVSSISSDLNVTTLPTSKLLKEKYDINITSTTPPMMTLSSATTQVATTVKSFTTTPLPEMPPKKPSNITNTTVDDHVYYKSTFYLEEDEAMAFWVNFDELPKDKVTKHYMLSDSHRRAATVTLSFDFPFYGHPLRNITIATGGFLYMGDYMHSWLAATQYVAPLMANFDTSLSNESTVQFFDNGTAFIIEWNEVALRDEKQGGNFTFQATLLSNGDIIFVYRTIPVSVSKIGDDSHPVKVGLSDAYVVDRVIYFIRRKTIYEYHRIDMKKEKIGNHTAIYFTALTTCLNFRNCTSCMESNIGLDCVWCESAKRCSDGLDRQRQDWLEQRCDIDKTTIKCNMLPSTDLNPVVQPYTEMPSKTYTIHFPSETYDNNLMPAGPAHPFRQNIHEDDEVISQRMKGSEQGPVGVGGVVAILLILGLLLGVVAWIGYAYRNPHTSSGQLLIRYRPSHWRFRSGEARYTAASVHM